MDPLPCVTEEGPELWSGVDRLSTRVRVEYRGQKRYNVEVGMFDGFYEYILPRNYISFSGGYFRIGRTDELNLEAQRRS